MKILLVNDDGIDAAGILALVDTLSQEHEICVVAPASERSGYSHSLTYSVPIEVIQRTLPGHPDVKAFSTSGTPADCAKIGVLELYKEADMVISGINAGYNIGIDINYSGTFGAAMEAAVMGVRSVAVSQFIGGEPYDFIRSADFTSSFIKQIENTTLPIDTVLNVNLPPSNKSIKGIKVIEQGFIEYGSYYEKVRKTERGDMYQLRGNLLCDAQVKGDAWAVKNGYISITPIQFNRTDVSSLEILSKLDFVYDKM